MTMKRKDYCFQQTTHKQRNPMYIHVMYVYINLYGKEVTFYFYCTCEASCHVHVVHVYTCMYHVCIYVYVYRSCISMYGIYTHHKHTYIHVLPHGIHVPTCTYCLLHVCIYIYVSCTVHGFHLFFFLVPSSMVWIQLLQFYKVTQCTPGVHTIFLKYTIFTRYRYNIIQYVPHI